MKKSLLFALALFAAMSASAQREYQDGVYTIIGQRGNKVDVTKGGRCQQPQYYIEDNTQCINSYDDVIETESSVKNVLVKDYQTINYYHENVVKENHYYVNNRPVYHRATPRRVIPRESYSNYEPVQSFNYNHQVSDGNKWFFFFQFNSDYITNREELGHLIDYAKSNPYTSLYIDSYADAETGTLAQNESISKRRASAVINFLLREGISIDRLYVKHHGCINQPYSTNNLNRCVTVKSSF